MTKVGSYNKEDVTFLLKDISNNVEEYKTEERYMGEQSHRHYSETLPMEELPTEEYMEVFNRALVNNIHKVGEATCVLSERILDLYGDKIVLVSLARAGTPIGINVKRYIKDKHSFEIPHYSISIIRGKGFDENAIKYILEKHSDRKMIFIDGWTGKGAITKVLEDSCREIYYKYNIVIEPILGVLTDPAHSTDLFGTREDFLIPSSCLNSTISGLLSRTVHNDNVIDEKDFHGVKYYTEFEEHDLSRKYVDMVSDYINNEGKEIDLSKNNNEDKTITWYGWKVVEEIGKEYNISDMNLIKPGIGETTRVLLRRIPWKILVKDINNKDLEHIILLAKEKNVPIELREDMPYACCGIILEKE